jgi:hypothetical protein
MSIEFNEKWAEGLDGEQSIRKFVEAASETLSTIPHALRTGGAAAGIDYALAAVCDNADTEQEAYHHLCFIVAELEKVRLNMQAGLTGTRVADSFEWKDHVYVPEERENVGGETGWIWTRWTRQKGGGRALSGRAFLASDATLQQIVARFNEMDLGPEGDDE